MKGLSALVLACGMAQPLAAERAAKIDGDAIFGLFEACVAVMVEGAWPDMLGKPFAQADYGTVRSDTYVLDAANPERVMVGVTVKDGTLVDCAVMASQLRSAPASDTAAIAAAQAKGEASVKARQAQGWPASPLYPERVFDLCVAGRTVRVDVEESRTPYGFRAKAGVASKGQACGNG